MPSFRGISYPVPVGVPPRWSDMEYETATALLPLETELVEHLYKQSECELESQIEDLKIYSRQHTVVGHYSNFSSNSVSVPENPENEQKDFCHISLKDSPHIYGVIFFIYFNKLDSIEIHGYGDEEFPHDGITRSIKAITFDDPNLSNWIKEIVQ